MIDKTIKLKIEIEKKVVSLPIRPTREIPSFEKALDGYLDFRYGFLPPPDFIIKDDVNTFTIGTTSYADLNTRSSGSDTYTGTSTTLYVDSAGSNAASAVGTVGNVNFNDNFAFIVNAKCSMVSAKFYFLS